ncbi:acyl-CoA dehydrogenase [Imbroritus primus]|uniref:acyl-CoA dehydrogenase n=1 Tax=Imbroritus primus TaxID=3058603 RepID=UPI003D1605BB
MTSMLINREDLDFLLFDLVQAETLVTRDRYAEHSADTFRAIIEAAHTLAEEKFAPHNRKADENEPTFDGERVHMIPEVAEAVKAFADGGFMAAPHDEEWGGMQLPITINQACLALFRAANVGSSAYSFLTSANANLIRAFGTESQKQRFLPPMFEGRWFGTMALTEPHAGSSVPDIRTTATPVGDGTYRIKGNKIFISGGDHELGENIVHLVLARLPGAPAGARGISLFLVPKFRVDADGKPGARNDVALAGLIHKMGYRGTTSTMLNFGENDDCIGELIGEENRGLTCMFHMMNEARIGVGMGGTMLAYTAYLHAAEYARTRAQGRPIEAKDPTAPQVPIIEHADVRRMLLIQKSYVEGALGLCFYAARLADDARTAPDAAERADAEQLLALLTPIVKSWPAQFCLEANHLAIQIHGGYGYTREYPVEQFYRDNRLNALHEGTHGIQGIDLLGRKVALEDGAVLALLRRRIAATADSARACGNAELASHADALQAEWDTIAETTTQLRAVTKEDIRRGLANASLYLDMFGHGVIAWIWLQQAVAAHQAQQAGTRSAAFCAGKLAAARWFFNCELPKAGPQHALLRRLDATALDAQADWF